MIACDALTNCCASDLGTITICRIDVAHVFARYWLGESILEVLMLMWQQAFRDQEDTRYAREVRPSRWEHPTQTFNFLISS